MATFETIPQALHHAVFTLAAKGHSYILNVRGPREIEQSQASTIQVVPSAFVYDDGDLGLTIHMPFDPASGTFTELVRFLGTQGNELFDRFERDEIPVFAIRLGQDIDLGAQPVFRRDIGATWV